MWILSRIAKRRRCRLPWGHVCTRYGTAWLEWFTTLLQSACIEKWETLETMASYCLRERQILDFGQSSWTGLPMLLDPASRNSNFTECDWCGSAKAVVVASPLVLLQSLQLLQQINTYLLYNFMICRVFLHITIAAGKTEKTGTKFPVKAALQCI